MMEIASTGKMVKEISFLKLYLTIYNIGTLIICKSYEIYCTYYLY